MKIIKLDKKKINWKKIIIFIIILFLISFLLYLNLMVFLAINWDNKEIKSFLNANDNWKFNDIKDFLKPEIYYKLGVEQQNEIKWLFDNQEMTIAVWNSLSYWTKIGYTNSSLIWLHEFTLFLDIFVFMCFIFSLINLF